MAYSLDFRQRAMALLADGYSIEDVSSLLNVGTATLWRWNARAKSGQLGTQYPKTRGFYKVDEGKLRAYVERNPDAYQYEIARDLGLSRSAVQCVLHRLHITRKKDPTISRTK